MKPVLDSVHAAWRKLEREAYRSFHAKTKNHMADHFFNFCVTGHAMRDFYLEHRGVPKGPLRKPYHAAWDSDLQLLAVKEIANLSKHFALRHFKTGEQMDPRTRQLVQRRSWAFDVFIGPKGEIKTVPRPAPEILVVTADGARYDIWEFVNDVLEYWREFLKENGVNVRRQSVAALLDGPAGGSALQAVEAHTARKSLV